MCIIKLNTKFSKKEKMRKTTTVELSKMNRIANANPLRFPTFLWLSHGIRFQVVYRFALALGR